MGQNNQNYTITVNWKNCLELHQRIKSLLCSNVKAIVTCIDVKILFLMFVDQPSWTMYIQVMTFEEAEKFRWNPFDLTKVKP